MKDFSYITNSHPAFIESLYQDYLKDPNSIDPEMKKFFDGFDFAVSLDRVSGANGATKAATNGFTNGSNGAGGAIASAEIAAGEAIDWKKEVGAYRLILGYRNKGHLIAKTNPIRQR